MRALAVAGSALTSGQGCDCEDPPARPRPDPRIGGGFALTDTEGGVVTDRSHRGRPHAILLGFTRCPGACSATLAQLVAVRRRLGPAGARLEILFISVDPAPRQAALLRRHLGSVGSRIVGASGTDAQLARALRHFSAFVTRGAARRGGAIPDRNGTVFLLGRRETIGDDRAECAAGHNARQAQYVAMAH